MSKNNAKILLFLLAVLMVGATYMYVFKPNQDETAKLESEAETLETKLKDLKAKEADREMYETQIVEFNEGFQEIIAEFPAALNQEVTVMFVKGVEDVHQGEFQIASTGLGAPQQFYTLAGSTDAEGNVTGGYTCEKAIFPISYTGSYEGVKDFVEYIMNYKYRMNISDISIAYDEANDIYSGGVTLYAYSVAGEGRTPESVDLDVETGVDNIFHGGAGAPAAETYEYDEDDGASIKGDHDIKIMLNNANNDATDGVIVSAGSSDTYVTYGNNDVASLEIKVYEEDGKNYMSYTIGDQTYSAEITSSDLTIYVESSQRVDSDDKNGVKVSVSNTTSVPVFFKVDGDDTTAPRFAMGSKSGTVKVY